MRWFLLFLLLAVQPALAWGPSGHRAVAQMAQHMLPPSTWQRVHALLGDMDLADVANWADEIRHSRRDTAPWHYIDIPLDSTDPLKDMDAFCGDGNCIVAQIGIDEAELRNLQGDAIQRREALNFLVHFVGDIHMPLHCANDNDKGGNDKKILEDAQATNLHAVWDNMPDLLDVSQMEHDITPQQRALWDRGDARLWALESWKIAKTVVYPSYKPQLDASYQQRMLPIVRKQVEKAASRLAWVLQRIYP